MLANKPWNIFSISVPVFFLARPVKWLTFETALPKFLAKFSSRSPTLFSVWCAAPPIALIVKLATSTLSCKAKPRAFPKQI